MWSSPHTSATNVSLPKPNTSLIRGRTHLSAHCQAGQTDVVLSTGNWKKSWKDAKKRFDWNFNSKNVLTVARPLRSSQAVKKLNKSTISASQVDLIISHEASTLKSNTPDIPSLSLTQNNFNTQPYLKMWAHVELTTLLKALKKIASIQPNDC